MRTLLLSLVNAISFCSFASRTVLGFQPLSPLPPVIQRPLPQQPERSRHFGTSYRRCQPNNTQKHQSWNSVSASRFLHVPSPPRQSPSSTMLYAFNPNNNIKNLFNPKPNYGPIKDWKDALNRVQMVLTATIKQFSSAFITGYCLGSFWSIISPPASILMNRGAVWGLDFGFLAAMFNGGNMVVDLFFSQTKDQQNVQLWHVVLRNFLLAIYFARNKTIPRMIRSAVMYGGLTYYFVSKKNKRDDMRMEMFQGMDVNGQSPQQATLQELLRRMSQQQNFSGGAGVGGASWSSSASSSTTNWASSSSSESSSTSSPSKKSKPSPKDDKNVVDVEFEKVYEDDSDDTTKE